MFLEPFGKDALHTIPEEDAIEIPEDCERDEVFSRMSEVSSASLRITGTFALWARKLTFFSSSFSPSILSLFLLQYS